MGARGQERRPWLGQRPATPAQVAGGAPLGGRPRGLREPTAAPPRRQRLGIARVVGGLAPREGLQSEGRAEATRAAGIGTEVSAPGPGAQALDRHDAPLALRGHGGPDGLRGGLQMARPQHLAALLAEAEVQGAGRQGAAAGKGGLRGRKSP
jgi:hypothetical protein